MKETKEILGKANNLFKNIVKESYNSAKNKYNNYIEKKDQYFTNLIIIKIVIIY